MRILQRKYDCQKGDLVKCVGEKQAIWQLEGGKTLPKAHEGNGYKWMMLVDWGEEEKAKAAKDAAEAAAVAARRRDESDED